MPADRLAAADLLARNVAAERVRLGWTQQQLADRLGWTQEQVSKSEGGRRRLTIDDIIALCRALGCPLIDLLHGVDAMDVSALGL